MNYSYYIWILNRFSESVLFLPQDIIILILKLCKGKVKLVRLGSFLAILNNGKINVLDDKHNVTHDIKKRKY